MGRIAKIHWFWYCILIFVISRAIMGYEFEVARDIFIPAHAPFFNTMCHLDCKWYLTIIRDGYDLHIRTFPLIWKGTANWAFFPLYPYLVKAVSLITGLNVVMLGIMLNQIFIFGVLILFYKYLKLFFDEINSRFGVFLIAFSPFSVYFASLYTEALFLLLSLAAFYLMRIRHPYWSAICGALLSATRPVGVVFGIVYFIQGIRNKVHPLSFSLICGTVISVLGLICYMVYLSIHMGDPLAFIHIQRAWGRTGFSDEHITNQLLKLISDYHNSIMFIVSCILSVYLFMSKFFEEALFNLLCILPGILTGSMMSEARFSGTLFTFYLGLVLLSRKSSSLKIGLSIVFFIFYTSYILYWVGRATFLA